MEKALFRGPFVSGPVSRILSERLSVSPGPESRGPPKRPAAYLDLAGQGRRSCLALHRAGFAWPPRRRDAGALLPHHFTFACSRLTCGRAIGCVFLWHSPAGFPGWALPTALPSGVRTFLEGFSLLPQSLGPLSDGSAEIGLVDKCIEYPERRCPLPSSPEQAVAWAALSPSSWASRGFISFTSPTSIPTPPLAPPLEIGTGARSAALDVRDEAACRALAADATARGGTLDVWLTMAWTRRHGRCLGQDETTRGRCSKLNALDENGPSPPWNR